jgi:hypothetical protein
MFTHRQTSVVYLFCAFMSVCWYFIKMFCSTKNIQSVEWNENLPWAFPTKIAMYLLPFKKTYFEAFSGCF